jgi:hypothetical protein
MALTPDQVLAEAADEIPIEDFIRTGNARDRGERVPALTPPKPAEPPPTEPAKPAAAPVAATPEPKPAPVAEPPKPRASIQARIDKAAAAQRDAERRATEAENRLRVLESGRNGTAPVAPSNGASGAPQGYSGQDASDPEPTIEAWAKAHPDDPDPYTSTNREYAKWAARVEGRRMAYQQQQQFGFQQRMAKFQSKTEDFDKRKPGARAKLDPAMTSQIQWSTPVLQGNIIGDLLVDSDNPFDILEYLNDNRHEFQRLASLHPALVAMEIGKISGRLAAASSRPSPPPVIPSNAKPPIKPLGSSPVATAETPDDDDDLSEEGMNNFIRRGNAQDRKKPRW